MQKIKKEETFKILFLRFPMNIRMTLGKMVQVISIIVP